MCDGCDFLLSAETNLFHRIGWMGPGLEQALETQHPPMCQTNCPKALIPTVEKCLLEWHRS